MAGKSASAPPISTCVLCTDGMPRESSIRLLVALRQDRPPRLRLRSVRSATVAASRKFLNGRFSHDAPAASGLEARHQTLSFLCG